MSISSTTSRVDFTGNGTQSVFAYTFKVFSEDDLLVTVRNTTTGVETTLVKTTDYTVSGVGETAGGNVTLVDAAQAWVDAEGDLDTGYVLSIRRSPSLVQETDIRNQGAYFPETIEDQFDKQTFIDQKQQDELDRSSKLPETVKTSDFDPSLPTDIAGTTDTAIITNPSGNGLVMGPSSAEIAAAEGHAIDASEHKQTAERWANLTSGTVVDVDTGVDSLEYSAKEYAQGVQAGTGGSSKDWAQETATDVDSSGDYSAKEHAIGTQTRGTAGGGSAKDWANYTGGTVDDVEFSSKKYATDAAASAAAAATAATSSLWNDVSFKVFGDSPIAIVDADSGTMFAIDCSGGNVVVNLPLISTLTLSGPWSVGFKKTDTSSNTITINANASDNVDGGASITVDRAQEGVTLIPDTDPTPDNWTSITYNQVNITGDIVGTTDTQDLSNKTFTDAVTLEEQASTPATPASGDKKIYPKTDGKLYTLNSAGEEVEVGSGGGGAGGINYILNPDAETNTTGWATYNDGAVAAPVDGTGGTVTSTFSRSGTPNNLRGDFSFVFIKPASDEQGEGFSYDFAIDQSDVNKNLFVSFDHRQNTTDYVSGDVKVYIYDIDNLTLIGTVDNGNDGDLPAFVGTSPTTSTKFTGRFQATDSLNYRLIFHVATTNANLYNVFTDNIKVGPDVTVPGAIVDEWQTFTPTFNNVTVGNGSVEGLYRRVGDSMQVRASLVIGSTTSVTGTINVVIPDSKTIDSNKNFTILSSSPQYQYGVVTALDSGTSFITGTVGFSSATSVAFVSDGGASNWAATVPFTWATGDELGCIFTVPIQDWSAGASLSTTETLFSSARVFAEGNAATVITANVTPIDFIEISDNTGSWDGSTFTAPRTSSYLITGGVFASSSSASFYSYVNGTIDKLLGTAAATTVTQLSGVIELVKGDLLTIRSNAGITLTNNANNHWLSIKSEEDFSTFSVWGENEYLSATSSTKTPVNTTDNFYQMTGNSVTLTPGVWHITGSVDFFNSATANWTQMGAYWTDENGDDTATFPDNLGTAAGITVQAGGLTVFQNNFTTNSRFFNATTLRVLVTQNSSVFLVPRGALGTAAEGRVIARIYAERIA